MDLPISERQATLSLRSGSLNGCCVLAQVLRKGSLVIGRLGTGVRCSRVIGK